MGQLYTAGNWVAKAGKEAEFVRAWRELAEWTAREVPGSSWGRLLQDRDDPRRFLSFGPWESIEAVQAWRADPGFQERVAGLRELLDEFEPRVLEAVAEVGL